MFSVIHGWFLGTVGLRYDLDLFLCYWGFANVEQRRFRLWRIVATF